MGKVVHNDVLDAMLLEIADNGDEIHVCSQEPANYTEASSTHQLASATGLATGDGGGNYTIADGDASGRKLTVAQQVDLLVDNDGDAAHVAICNNASAKVLLVTTCATQNLTAGNTVTVPEFKDEIADPS